MSTISEKINSVVVSTSVEHKLRKGPANGGHSDHPINSVPKQDDREQKFQKVIEYLASVPEQKFTGYIKINYSQGSIGRVERFEEILKK